MSFTQAQADAQNAKVAKGEERARLKREIGTRFTQEGAPETKEKTPRFQKSDVAPGKRFLADAALEEEWIEGRGGMLFKTIPQSSQEPAVAVLTPKPTTDSGRGVKFTIPGDPVAKPRMTNRDRWMKRPITTRYWEWVNAAKLVIPPIPSKAGAITLSIFIAFPKSYGKRNREQLAGTPNRGRKDLDNFLKAAMDTIFPEQDCGIWRVSAEKLWEDENGPRIEIEVI